MVLVSNVLSSKKILRLGYFFCITFPPTQTSQNHEGSRGLTIGLKEVLPRSQHTPQTIFSARSCSSCQRFSHASCIKDDILCQLCKKQGQIIAQRQGAKRKQQDQAEKMLERSIKRFKEAQVGDTVPIPDLDRISKFERNYS